jgi:hypothetical protein
MQAVLYTHEMEPITVIGLASWAWEKLWRGERIVIAVMEPIHVWMNADPNDFPKVRKVEIYGEVFERRGNRTMMLFTGDEESALLLKADFLPGQRSELQAREGRAFAKGFFDALQRGGYFNDL